MNSKCVNGNCGYEFDSDGMCLYEDRGEKYLYDDNGRVACPCCRGPVIELEP